MSQVFYCHRLTSDVHGLWYAHFAANPKVTEMYDDTKTPIKVSVEEDPNGTYFGWEYAETKKFSMIYPSIKLVEICFPYGTDAAAKAGQGRVVKLKITEMPEGT